jgi:hypothetical protein
METKRRPSGRPLREFKLLGFAVAIPSQCRRCTAEVRTRNWPDAGLRKALVAKNNNYTNKKIQDSEAGAVFPSVKRQNEYLGYRAGTPDRMVLMSSMPVLVGAAMIAAAILLSTLVAALGNRYVGIEGPTEDSAWLIDRLTGSVYRCEAQARGKASCDLDIATGSIAARPKP